MTTIKDLGRDFLLGPSSAPGYQPNKADGVVLFDKIYDDIQAVADGITTGSVPYGTWLELYAIVPSSVDLGASVADEDTGTHTGYTTDSPTVMVTGVPNPGIYRSVLVSSVYSWLRVGSSGLSGKATVDQLNAEIAARTAADTALSGSISTEAATRASADTAEATARAAADTALGTQITDVSTVLGPAVAGDGISLQSNDAFDLLTVDAISGAEQSVAGLEYLALARPSSHIPGGAPMGGIFGYTSSGDYGQYWLENSGATRRVIVHDTGDRYAPHLLDTGGIEIIELDGQSWNTMPFFLADIAVRDPTGEVTRRVRNWTDPDVVCLRRGVKVPSEALPWIKKVQSDGGSVVDFHRFRPGERYSMGEIAVACLASRRRELGLKRRAIVALGVGWPGQPWYKFLPEGTTVGSQAAELVSGETEFLWARNITTRAQVASFIASLYPGREVFYSHVLWTQGTSETAGEYGDFLDAYRTAQDALKLRTVDATKQRCIFIDQRASEADDAYNQIGAEDQLEWAKTNAIGKNFLVGPRYPHWMQDNIHHTAKDALDYAERQAIAMAMQEAWGTYEPLWHTNISVSGDTITVTVNSPRQASGGLVVDTTALPAATAYGFQLRDTADLATVISLTVTVSGNTVTIVSGTSLGGKTLQFSYAHRGVAQTSGTPTVPAHSGCWGNIKKVGAFQGVFSPGQVDQWLCDFIVDIAG